MKTGKFAAQKIGYCGSLTACGIHPSPSVGQKNPAHALQKTHGIFAAEARERAGDLFPIVRKIMLRAHIEVGHVALTVSRGGKFPSQPFPPFEKGDVFALSCQHDRGGHARRPAADNRDFSHIPIIPLPKLFVNGLTAFDFCVKIRERKE